MLEAPESPEHEKLVAKLIEWMNSDGFQVYCASHDGYKTCESIDGYVPDCIGSNKRSIAVGEAMTVDDIRSDHAKEQIKIGANGVTNMGGWKDEWIPFYMAIPDGSDVTLQEVLKEMRYLNRNNIKVRSYQV